jgi:RecJ-like exonuclease
MKKLRKEVLEEAGYICEKCGGRADRIHHKDFDKSHQAKENYMPICHGCNLKFHSKYRWLYGLTLQEMADKYGGGPSKYSLLESQGRLKEYLLAS